MGSSYKRKGGPGATSKGGTKKKGKNQTGKMRKRVGREILR